MGIINRKYITDFFENVNKEFNKHPIAVLVLYADCDKDDDDSEVCFTSSFFSRLCDDSINKILSKGLSEKYYELIDEIEANSEIKNKDLIQ